MTRLSQRAVGHYRSYVPAQAAGSRTRLEAIEATCRLPGGGLRFRCHRLLTCVDAIVHHLMRGMGKAM
jgi:hypothetical protein